MWRLRTTTGLSALALALGVAGTSWLSTLTASGYVPSRLVHVGGATPSALTPAVHRRAAHHARRAAAPPPVAQARSYRVRNHVVAEANPVAPPTVLPTLVPLTTAADTSLSWEQLRGHLHGRVLLQVSVDGSGRVSAASVAQSSGDEVLDTHALRSVWHWRFAVPEGQLAMRGEVPVRYASAAAP